MLLKTVIALSLGLGLAQYGYAQTEAPRYDRLANIPFAQGYPAEKDLKILKDELLFQRATQAYIWALPALNMYAMKEGSEKVFGGGYNVLPVFKERLNASTKVTTPNSDVIYAMGYLDLGKDGPMVIEVPPGLQGILDDFYQRPICTVNEVDGRQWCGDVGLPGPDRGKGGRYLVLPPDYNGDVPQGYITMRSRTNGVFVFWRGFFADPKDLAPPVKVIEQTKIYPLGGEATARPMRFPDASAKPANMLYPEDGTAFDMLNRFIQSEYPDPHDAEMRGMLASFGIIKGKPFNPDAHTRDILDKAAKTGFRMVKAIAFDTPPIVDNTKWYKDRRWVNPFPVNADFTAPAFNYIDLRTGFFSQAYSASPGMALSMVKVGAKYPVTFTDAKGDYLMGDRAYKLHLPPDVPAAIFWSVTVYDAANASGLDNGQPFPSINTMDKPVANPDGSFDIHFGPQSPGEGKNWLKTVPGKGFFVILRLYGPTQPFFDQSWKPGDVENLQPSAP